MVPARFGQWMAKALARVAYRILAQKVRESLLQIETRLKVSPEKAKDILCGSFQHFALNWMAQVAPAKFLEIYTLNFYGLEKIEQAHAKGQGTVIAAMHMGLWEFVPQILKSYNCPVAIVVAVQHNPLCDKIFNQFRSSDHYHYILHNRLGVRHLLKYLKSGGTVVILSDVDIGGTGLSVPFLDQVASTPSWPAELALRTGAQMLLGYTVISDGTRIEGHLVDLPDPATVLGQDQAAKKLCETMNLAMSQVVRQYPEQWFWMQRRWKTPVANLKD